AAGVLPLRLAGQAIGSPRLFLDGTLAELAAELARVLPGDILDRVVCAVRKRRRVVAHHGLVLTLRHFVHAQVIRLRDAYRVPRSLVGGALRLAVGRT